MLARLRALSRFSVRPHRSATDSNSQAPRPALGLEPLEAREVPAILGAAASYNVFGLARADIDLSGRVADQGTLAVAAHGSADLTGFASVTGTATLDPTASSRVRGFAGVGAVQRADLSQAAADALAGAAALTGMTPTQTFGVIHTSTVISGNGGQNVIDIDGIQLDGSKTLTLSGGANDYFYINDAGRFDLSDRSAIVLAGGVQASHVIFNVEGAGRDVVVTDRAVAQGTILAPHRDIELDSVLVGSIIGAQGHSIDISGRAQVLGVSFAEPVAATGGTGTTGGTGSTGTASISGNVKYSMFGGDSIGPEQGATVTLTDASGNAVATATTDVNGNYTLGQLSAGTYTLTVVANGYNTQTQTVTLTAGQAMTDNFLVS
jgi:hypothetical protein